MLTGKRLFEGETISHVMADVLKGEIDFGKFPKATPAAIRNLLRRCLDRDVKNRLRDVGEVRIVINNVGKEPEAATPVIPAPRYRLLPWIMAAVLGAIAVVVSFVHFRETPRAESVLNLSVALPPNADQALWRSLRTDSAWWCPAAADFSCGRWIQTSFGPCHTRRSAGTVLVRRQPLHRILRRREPQDHTRGRWSRDHFVR